MKKQIRKLRKLFFAFTGFFLARRPKYNGRAEFSIEKFHYGISFPSANYTPWEGDREFLEIFQQVQPFTLVDIYRCYELWQLVAETARINKDASCIEIGVWRGGSAAIIARKLYLLNSPSRLYLADTFSGVAKATNKDYFYVGGEHGNASEAMVGSLLKTYSSYSFFKILGGVFPDETAKHIHEEEIFSFCHIDVDVYLSARDIVEWIWPRMIVGGIIVFDDYGFHTCIGVTKYVEELRALQDRLIIHNLNGHAIMIKMK